MSSLQICVFVSLFYHCRFMELNMTRTEVVIYTDGACTRNPGEGGWAAILLYPNHRKDIHGRANYTTNNKMELTAVINALKVLEFPCAVKLYTDSTYVKNGITQWIHEWKINGWRTSNGNLIKNIELWKELDEVTSKHTVHWNWVKGHSSNKYNNEVNCLARKAKTLP